MLIYEIWKMFKVIIETGSFQYLLGLFYLCMLIINVQMPLYIFLIYEKGNFFSKIISRNFRMLKTKISWESFITSNNVCIKSSQI